MDAILSADGNTLSGTMTIGGATLPFELRRQPGPPAPPPAESQKAIAGAREVLGLLRAGKFEDIVREFDTTMKAALTVDTLKGLWASVRVQVGEYKSELSTRVALAGNLTAVTLGCQFEKASIDVLVVLDPENRIAGLQFIPRNPA
jgi:hypothetical protein